jgi:P27 family predicted phage terminase small subunit
MGLRGPAPKPNAVRIADGNPARRPINGDSPQFAEGEPKQPSGMSAEGRREWRRLVPILLAVPGLLTEADGHELADMCEARVTRQALVRAIDSRRRRAVTQIAEQANERGVSLNKAEIDAAATEAAMTFKTPSGYIQQHPDVGMINALQDLESRIRQRFGMTPSARSSLRISGGKVAEVDALDSHYSRGPRLVKNVV